MGLREFLEWIFLTLTLRPVRILAKRNLWMSLIGIEEESHHECEILPGRRPEAAESEHSFRQCKKNRGHENFILAQNYKDNYLPSFLVTKDREMLRAWIDLTVRLRVRFTSVSRPDNDPLSYLRGVDALRVGTGFLNYVTDCENNEACPCCACGGQVGRKFWKVSVWTAHHVVFNSEEAKDTKVDLFYDEESCLDDGRMKTLEAFEMVASVPLGDFCDISCVTHDESLVERIKLAKLCLCNKQMDLSSISRLQNDTGLRMSHDFAVIVSHPHGQPKMVTIGQAMIDPDKDGSIFSSSIYRNNQNITSKSIKVEYSTATCPGSSGAPVFPCMSYGGGVCEIFQELAPIHSGTYDIDTKGGLVKFVRRIFHKFVKHKLFEFRQQNFAYSILYSETDK